jgi:hypothetical protein
VVAPGGDDVGLGGYCGSLVEEICEGDALGLDELRGVEAKAFRDDELE